MNVAMALPCIPFYLTVMHVILVLGGSKVGESTIKIAVVKVKSFLG